jgi:hypothetical protein
MNRWELFQHHPFRHFKFFSCLLKTEMTLNIWTDDLCDNFKIAAEPRLSENSSKLSATHFYRRYINNNNINEYDVHNGTHSYQSKLIGQYMVNEITYNRNRKRKRAWCPSFVDTSYNSAFFHFFSFLELHFCQSKVSSESNILRVLQQFYSGITMIKLGIVDVTLRHVSQVLQTRCLMSSLGLVAKM